MQKKHLHRRHVREIETMLSVDKGFHAHVKLTRHKIYKM